MKIKFSVSKAPSS
jgi:hypothetical protein